MLLLLELFLRIAGESKLYAAQKLPGPICIGCNSLQVVCLHYVQNTGSDAIF
jgi:hypothetical protein